MSRTGLTLLQNAVILDTETTGLTRGSGIHELAVFDLQKQKVYEYLLEPRLISTQANPLQETTRLASSPFDVHTVHPEIRTWRDLIIAQVHMEAGITGQWDDIKRSLEWHNPFLARVLDDPAKGAFLMGRPAPPQALRAREQALKAAGDVKHELGVRTAIEDVLQPGGALERKLRGKTIWIANAAFESKQLGAQLGAMGEVGADFAARLNLETRNPRNARNHRKYLRFPSHLQAFLTV